MAPAAAPRAWWVGLAGAVAGAVLADPERLDRLPVLCPFRRVTGLPCPTCGLMRSWSHTVRLNLGAATSHHPLGPPSLIVAAVVLADARVRDRLIAGVDRAPFPAILIGAGAWVAFWVLRILSVRR